MYNITKRVTKSKTKPKPKEKDKTKQRVTTQEVTQGLSAEGTPSERTKQGKETKIQAPQRSWFSCGGSREKPSQGSLPALQLRPSSSEIRLALLHCLSVIRYRPVYKTFP